MKSSLFFKDKIQGTMKSQYSNIDFYIKSESHFLSKYFKHILILDCSQYISSQFIEHIQTETDNLTLIQGLFKSKKISNPMEFEELIRRKINVVQPEPSKTDFKLIYQNRKKWEMQIAKGELILVYSKIKIENCKIIKIIDQALHQLKQIYIHWPQKFDCLKTLHLWIVYFGDISYQFHKKQCFSRVQQKIGNKYFKVSKSVFFISKIRLTQYFFKTNYLKKVDTINQYVMTLYEKKRKKKLMNQIRIKRQKKIEQQIRLLIKGLLVFSIFTTICIMVYKTKQKFFRVLN